MKNDIKENTKEILFNTKFISAVAKDMQSNQESQLQTNQLIGECLAELAETISTQREEIESLSAIIIKMSNKIAKLEKKEK